MDKKFAVVIPTYNEAENIPALLGRLNQVYELTKDRFEMTVIFVDDNSPDGTAKVIATESQKRKYKVGVIRREGKLGLGSAYIAGFEKALGDNQDVIIQMDADLSHEPETIIDMLAALETSDMVIGSRYIKGGKLPEWTWLRKLISKGGNLYSRIILGFSIHDYTGGFNAYSKTVLESIDLDKIRSNGYSFQIEMKYRTKQKGFSITEVPIEFKDRTHGKSKFSKKIFFEALVNTVKLRLGIP